jgi:hypothetical protein
VSGVELAEDICSRLDDILIEESPMHPFGCATWEESSRVAIDMAKEAIRRAVPVEPVAWRSRSDAWEPDAPWALWAKNPTHLANLKGFTVQALAVIPAPGNKEEK